MVTGEYRPGAVRHVTAGSARLRRDLDRRPVVPFAAGTAEPTAGADTP
ncbi:hypothetical protein [Streptomyces flavotricini]